MKATEKGREVTERAKEGLDKAGGLEEGGVCHEGGGGKEKCPKQCHEYRVKSNKFRITRNATL